MKFTHWDKRIMRHHFIRIPVLIFLITASLSAVLLTVGLSIVPVMYAAGSGVAASVIIGAVRVEYGETL